jgi:coenzyme F420-reducing hydrogenase gamma subunit
MPGARKPKLAVWKFASCDGCQLSLLDCEDELLAVAGAVEIAYFPEASRAMAKGPYDLSLVEGSITTHHDAERIQQAVPLFVVATEILDVFRAAE